MPSRLSRRVLAKHAAVRLMDGDASVMDELAALLVNEGRTREADSLIRDIEDELEEHGQLVVSVESARRIDGDTRQKIADMFSGKTVHIREIIRPELIGGVRISTPARTLDASVLGKLKTLRGANL